MSDYKFKGKLSDEAGRGVSGVTITITYQEGFGQKIANGGLSFNAVTANPQVKPKTTTVISDQFGYWQVQIKSTYQIFTNNPNYPFTFTFSKEGLETVTIKNPRIGGEGTINFDDLKTYIDPLDGGVLELQRQYESGYWKVTSFPQETQTFLDKQMDNLMQFLKNNPGNTKITIKSSESLPGNADREPTSKTFNSSLARGVLAQKRSDDLKLYILNKLTSLSSSYPGVTIPNIIVEKPTIGKEKWPDEVKNNELMKTEKDEEGNPITNPALLSRYSKEQWVKIYAELQRPKVDCFNNGYLVFDVSVDAHKCNAGVFEIYANGILLKRDDGQPFASLNNNMPTINSNSYIGNYAKLAGIMYLDAKDLLKTFNLQKYDNAYPLHIPGATGYHIDAKQDSNLGIFRKGRFKEYREGDVFPTPTKPIPSTQVPAVDYSGGARYNRFIITAQMFKEMKAASGNELIEFKIKCAGIANNKGVPFYDNLYATNCHPGLGDFHVYMLKPSTNADGTSNLIVEFESGKLAGATPEYRDQYLDLFKFDPCYNKLVDKNPDVFSSTSLKDVKNE